MFFSKKIFGSKFFLDLSPHPPYLTSFIILLFVGENQEKSFNPILGATLNCFFYFLTSIYLCKLGYAVAFMAFRTEDFKLHSRETTLVKMYFMIKIKIEKVYELYTSDGFIARGKAKADGEAERRVGTKPKLSINDVQGAQSSLGTLQSVPWRGASVSEEQSAIFPGMKTLPVGKE